MCICSEQIKQNGVKSKCINAWFGSYLGLLKPSELFSKDKVLETRNRFFFFG